jgi:DnaJ homolog subfamily B member 12
MESNKDDSEKCIRIAEKHLSSGNIDAALKFLKKADRLYTTQRSKGKFGSL